MSLRWVLAISLLVSACGAASDVGSSATPSSLSLFDPVTTVDSVATDDSGGDANLGSSSSETGSSATSASVSTSEITLPDTTATPTSTEGSGPTTTRLGPTIPAVDPNAEFCQASVDIDDLGSFTDLSDTEAAEAYFNAQADRWDAAAGVAPNSIADDVRTVAAFLGDLRTLLADNDFDLFAVFSDVSELEVSSGSDVARIRVDQFVFSNCAIEPALPEQATAAFYIELLETAEDRITLAELLASAEVFSLDGARCFVDRATADVMHPLVGAPATPAQDAALSAVLSACQLSIGT